MKHTLEFKKCSPSPRERQIIEESIARLERLTRPFPSEAVFLRVFVERNPARTLYRVSLTLDVPGRTLATEEERHDAVEAIRDAFAEIERQLADHKEKLRHSDEYKRPARRRALRLKKAGVICLLLPALVGCSPLMVAGGLGYDAGTFGVSGVKTGIGGHLEVVSYRNTLGPGWRFGPAMQVAGYNSAGDADPQAFLTFDARYRRPFRPTPSSGTYWEVGTGGGVAWSAGIRAAAVPVQGEIGVQRQMGPVLLSAGVRERFLGLVGTGSPPLDAFNSVQVVVGVRFGGGR